ncbi:MAG: hypothetical protein ACKJSG_14815 [Lentisphaeria bacterium]
MTAASKPFNFIYEAEWNDVPCSDYPLTPERWVAESIRPLENSQVDTLFYNLCSSDGYVCDLDSGQILMDNCETLTDAWVWRYRENTKKLIAADANPPKLAVEHGHRLGLKVIPVVRMNDMHDMFYKDEVSSFKLENPQLLLGYGKYNDWERGAQRHPNPESMESFTWGGFDFAHQEVRDHRFAIIEEFLTRWDNDGVSLDFDRDPWFFREAGKEDNAALMTDLVRRVRAVADDVSKTRGRPQYLHVRVIPDMDICWQRGMDVKTWVEEGLVDAISPGCGYMTFTQDLEPWLELVRDKPCWIYPCNNHWKLPEITRAWAKLMFQRGAHGLYLFNWGHLLYGFDKDAKPTSASCGTVWYDELHPCYYEVMRQIGEAGTMAFENATYNLESVSHEQLPGEGGANRRESRAIDAIELPIELTVGQHSVNIPFAEDLKGANEKGLSPQMTLRLKISNYTAPDEFDVSINDQKMDITTRTSRAVFIMDNDTWFEYPLSDSMIACGDNELTCDVHKLNPQMSVTPVLMNVELVVIYRA